MSEEKAEATESEVIEKVTLEKVECLELQNLNLQRQLLQTQVQQQAAMLEAKEKGLTEQIKTKYGVDLASYRVNPETGECTHDPEGAAKAMASQQMQ